jgi:hypothetical protein
MNSWLSHGNLAGLGVSAGRSMVRRPRRDLSAIDMKILPNIGWPSPLHLWMVRFPSKRAGIVGKYADTGAAFQDPIAGCFGAEPASRVGGRRSASRADHGVPQEDRPSPAQTHTPPVLPAKLGTYLVGCSVAGRGTRIDVNACRKAARAGARPLFYAAVERVPREFCCKRSDLRKFSQRSDHYVDRFLPSRS